MKDINELRVTKMPGSYFAVNQDVIFPIENGYGIPVMDKVSPCDIDLSMPFLRYREKNREGICHFFLDDYRFESVWNHPIKALKAVLTYKGALAPNFSVYLDWPISIGIWNTYRSRWCGKLWQEYGQTVIPSVNWGDKDTYDFCFLGIPQGAVVSIPFFKNYADTPGGYFLKGYEELIKRIDPEKVLVYGNSNFVDELKDNRVIIKETFWQQKAKLEKNKGS